MSRDQVVSGHFTERKVSRSFSFDDIFNLLLKQGLYPKKQRDNTIVFSSGDNIIALKVTNQPITLQFIHGIRLPDGFSEVPLLYLLKNTVLILFALLSAPAFAGQPDEMAGLARDVKAAQALIKKHDCKKLDELYSRVEALLSDRENYAPAFGKSQEFKTLEKGIFKIADDEIVMRWQCQYR